VSKTPCFRFTLVLEKYPTSEGSTTYRWSSRPMADDGAFSEGRVITVGEIVRSCTDQDGNFELSSVTAELSDDDGLFRGLLDGATTQFFLGREGTWEVLSEAGRAAGSAWRPVHRGVVTDVQILPGRRARITTGDIIGSKFSAFALEKEIGVYLGDEHANLPDDSRKKIYPVIVGEHSDAGAIDANGDTAEKGLLPVIDTGDYRIDGSTEPPEYAGPPTVTSSGVTGSGGDQTYYYGFSVITAYGETVMSSVVTVSGAPSLDEMDVNNHVYVYGTYDPGPNNDNRVRVWGRSSNPPSTWLAEVNYTDATTGTWGYMDGAAYAPSPTRREVDTEDPGPNIGTSTALQDDGVWSRFVVSLGVTDIHQLFWSDLADGDTPKRVEADPALEGVEYILPSSPQWPHDDPYLELTNAAGETIRMTVFYARGPRVAHHRDGVVTMAVNGCGMEETGDGTGDLVDQAFYAGQLFINEHILKDNGTGYLSGNYGGLETFSDGDAQLWTSKWTAAQTLSISRVGGSGYLAAWAIHEPITVREWVRRFCLTFDCRLAVNRFGQIYPVLIDDLADVDTGRRYREREEGVELLDQSFAFDELENRITYNYDYDSDAQTFRVTNQTIEDAESIAANVPGGVYGATNPRGVYETGPQELYCTRDETTAVDTRARRLARNKRAPRYVTHAQDLIGLEDDLGDQTRFTHRDGLGASGDVDTPLCVLQHGVTSYGEVGTRLVGFDLARLLGYVLPLMDDEATMSANIGDETSAAQPPTGAYEVR
jgi:hypothetical protein